MTPGDVLGGRYELESRLGKGGMGEVWRARSVETGERVAVKVLLDDVAADKTLYKRFLREARAASAVKHPNVVELREVQEGEGGAPFLVMELLRGETLGRRLKREGALPAAETAAILLPVFDAVEAAHAAGIVHRDLKPENIFLARDGGDGGERVRVCVLDFGIAKRVEKLAAPVAAGAAETTAAAETTGAMLGTPYYMAPEQALGERDIDGRADVWALGVILYECLSGRRPTEAPTLGAILKIIVTDGVPPLGDVVTDVDPELAEAVTRMLRTSRAERAPTLDGVRAALARQRSSGVVLDLSIAEDEEVPASTASSTTGPTPRRSRRSWRSTLAAGGAAALALATLAFVGRSFDTSPAPATSAGRAGDVEGALATATTAPAHAGPPRAAEDAGAAAPAASGAPSAAPPAPAIGGAAASARAGVPAVPVARPASTPLASPRLPAVASGAPSAAPPASGPSRGPSGLVTDNPFATPGR